MALHQQNQFVISSQSMGLLLAILTGTALGYVLERGDFCFHSALRGLFRVPIKPDLFRAYLLTLLIATPLVQGMIRLELIEPWVAPFAWQANLLGGLLFGVGMVVASTCITGLFYKLGHGMLGMMVALVTWSLGDILTYVGPLRGLRDGLNSNPIQVEGSTATLLNALGTPIGWVLLATLGVVLALYLLRSEHQDRSPLWSWPLLGLGAALVTSAAWLLAKSGGANYTFGTSRVPTGLYETIMLGGGTHYWIPVTLFSLIIGAFVTAYFSGTLWVRGESLSRYLELAIGGLIMGIGAAISGGCNLGHSLVGVPLLSLGSISTTLAIAVGVFGGHHLLKNFGSTQSQA